MIDIVGVSKSFGQVKALDRVSFTVRNGEVVGYVGPNGAGKTTTIRICVGVLPPDEGDVVINGFSVVKEKKKASSYIGWVPETPIFEQDEKALNYFTYLAGYYGISLSEARQLGRKLLEEVGLGNALNMKLKSFSLGMKKRFALAMSMINNPDNFIFDEVLNGLDPIGIAFFRDLVRRFKREGRAILFSSHILKEVEDIADRVVFINKGRIVRVMSIDEVKSTAKPVLLIKVRAANERILDVLNSFGESVKLEGDTIRIINPRAEPSDVAEVLMKSGYKVEEIKREEASLEEVFFMLIRDENI